jgi:uncharacterized protein
MCCRWPGDVLFEPDALSDVAAYLGMDERTCADTFFDLNDDRRHLKTKATMHGGCIFVDEHGCRVHPVRPRQCRTFPYEWQRMEEECMQECRLYQAVRARRPTLNF